MKKLAIIFGLFLLACVYAGAVIAPKTPYKYTQPDGSVVTLVNHGDEFHNWITCNGQVVEIGKDGFCRPVSNSEAAIRPSAAALSRRAQAEQLYAEARQSALGMGTKKFLVILVEFSDLSFTVNSPKTAFSNMLNQSGYSANGGTGSAKDFYKDQSSDKFQPSFDVYGPVKVSKSWSYYGEQQGNTHDLHPDEAFWEAVTKIDNEVNFADYDNDNDGYIDQIFFYYAGHNQAEGGGVNTIWPHAWSFYYYQQYTFDNKKLSSYACTSEYRGSSGTNMAGIGTFCHEFGHVIGLPDFYDTDYEENGDALDMFYFTTMCSGPYLNSGRTPSNFTLVERNMLGWTDFPTKISTPGDITIEPLSQNVAYYTTTDVKDEVFVYECRNGQGWDKYLPTGMVVYHLDQSNNICHDNTTAAKMWDTNKINAYANHPCYYVVAADNYSDNAHMMFPYGNKKTFIPEAWSGNTTSFQFTNIAFENGHVTANVAFTSNRRVYGKVTDSHSVPLAGVSVLLEKTESGSSKVAPSAADRYNATTLEDGTFSIVLDEDDYTSSFTLKAYKQDYKIYTTTISFELIKEVNISLKDEDGSGEISLATMGFNSIRNPKASTGYTAGDSFQLKLNVVDGKAPVSTQWYFDGTAKNGTSVTLTAGTHTVKAVLTYSDGTTEDIFAELVVN